VNEPSWSQAAGLILEGLIVLILVSLVTLWGVGSLTP
jgi:hypothetical protein